MQEARFTFGIEDAGHPNGFWPVEKHEMSQTYAKLATGNYLWHVDVDEFYRKEDMPTMTPALPAAEMDPTIRRYLHAQ